MRRYSDAECRKLWDEKFTFFWYNQREIFEWSQSDFDHQAKQLAEAGITGVMTFSVTHFRWTFLRYKQEILEALRKLVKACHKYNITVEEHHSCHLTYAAKNATDLERIATHFKGRASNIEAFSDIIEDMTPACIVNGKNMLDWVQIDGSTGLPAETGYIGHAFCFNNPDYRREYFEYVRELAACGIDSLLADDVQYLGGGKACTCKHCRKLFYEQTGYTLPAPEHWNEFFDHYEREDFLAWRRFRCDSTRRFQLDLTKLYKSLGLEQYRVNYRSTLIMRDPTANTFTNSLELWAQTFQENQLSSSIRYSWPIFYCEALVQHSVGERKNAPSMSLFYPTRYDQYYMAWALSQSWGQLPFLCPEGFNMIEEDRFFNGFEKRYSDLFRQVHKVPDFGLLLSRESIDYTQDAYPDTLNILRCFMQGAYYTNLTATVVSEDEDQSAFDALKAIFLCGITRVLPEVLEKLTNYVRQGGKVFVVGKFGTVSAPADEAVQKFLQMPGVKVCNEFDLSGNFQFGATIPQMYDLNQTRPAEADRTAELREFGQKIRAVLGFKPTVETAPQGYLTTVYRTGRKENTLTLHLFNSNGLIQPEGTELSHKDIIGNFVQDAPRNPEAMEIVLNLDNIKSCRLYTPEQAQVIDIKVNIFNAQSVIVIPKDTFAGYAVLELTLNDAE